MVVPRAAGNGSIIGTLQHRTPLISNGNGSGGGGGGAHGSHLPPQPHPQQQHQHAGGHVVRKGILKRTPGNPGDWAEFEASSNGDPDVVPPLPTLPLSLPPPPPLPSHQQQAISGTDN